MVNRLPPLQRALARRLVEQAPGFFLAWEAALWVHGGHRSSESLELHATHAEDTVLSILSAEVEAFAREQSCDVRHSGTPVVSRFEISRAGERCVTTLRLQQLVLDPHRAEFDGVPVSTRREVRAWLLGRLVGEESTGVLADLALLLEGATHREALADAWALTDDAQPGLVAWALSRMVIDPTALPPHVDAGTLEALRVELQREAELQAAVAGRPT